ncbi:sensor domain-containing diguanylate cyclase [Oxalobacteraceae bacterium OTU3CINTB1]|nr:sensor domain-containing diguanylate cyclase [Oxalobacteraceae bacterium OTU3CINTB1]
MSQSTINVSDPIAPAPAGADGGAGASKLVQLEGKKRPIRRAASLFLVAILCAICGLQFAYRSNARQTQLDESARATVNIARATAEHAERTIDIVGSVLFGVVERVERDGTGPSNFARLQALLQARVAQTSGLQGIFVYDEHGRWVITSLDKVDPGANNADRPYFQYHRTHAGRGVHIGTPVRSRSSGQWILPVSQRVDHADGSFAGVVLATVRTDYFQQYYNGFDIGKAGGIFIALDDGTLIARRPMLNNVIGSSLKGGAVFTLIDQGQDSGTAMRVALVDNVERLYSYRRVHGYPLVIAASLSKDEIFAQWWTDTWRQCGALALLLATLGWLGTRLIRQISLRDHLEIELRHSQAALQHSVAQLELLATTDPLTGLKNRRHLNERLESELARAARDGLPVALVMLDIDFFKRYNDTYGHLAGDACLKLVSDVVARAAQRTADIAARFGGEEFVVFLPNTELAGAHAVAEGICAAVRALGQPHRTSDFGVVTISAGVAACVPVRGAGCSPLIGVADRALYDAKHRGRNRVSPPLRSGHHPLPQPACADA